MMRKHRWLLVMALLVGALSLLAVGCGGDDEEEGAGEGATTEAAGTTEAAEDVSGSIKIAGLWTGGEGDSFKAVLDGFREKYPDVTVTYQPAGEDLPTILATGVEGGNPPDLATLSSPGVIKSFVDKGALQPIDFATDALQENYSESFVDLTTFDGKTYGVVFKGANKSTVWYNTQAFEDAGVEAPTTWDELLEAGETLKASGVTPYSIGAADGWTLTDLFENVYLRTAGAEKYDQLATHEIPWTDQSVKDALAEMAKIFQSDNIAGGTNSALQTDFPTSVTQVFTDPPKAAMVMEGDFVGTFINTETKAKVGEGADVFTFPSINDSPPVVVGAGDSVVMFKDSPAARALVTYLASAEAAELWAERGGFSSPNKTLDESVYPDDTTRKLATELAQAETFRFDLSDLQPQVLNEALFAELANFVKDPTNIDGTAEKLESVAKQAYP
jgi:ABC-type glycerol-3-phosphate transport system substrate-binding protein